MGILQPESTPDHGPQLRRYIQVPRKQKCPGTLPRGWSRGDARDSWKPRSAECPPALGSGTLASALRGCGVKFPRGSGHSAAISTQAVVCVHLCEGASFKAPC